MDRNDKHFLLKRKDAIKKNLPYRILGESWWTAELPSGEELEEGIKNLDKSGFCVDYVITHCTSNRVQDLLWEEASPKRDHYTPDILTKYFDELEDKLQYKHWYFGHYHEDRFVDKKHTLLYKQILPLKEEV